jgi:hypothetical protein
VRFDLGVHGVWSEIEIARPPHGPELDPYLGEALGVGQGREHTGVRRLDAPAHVNDSLHTVMETNL